MAFVIVSTGGLAGSTLRTVRARSLVVAALAMTLAFVAGGAALGVYLAPALRVDSTAQAPGTLTLDPDRPEHRAMIERVGALSGRLIRLEGEAQRLAQKLGLGAVQAAEDGADSAPQAPSGGPFIASGISALPLRGLGGDLERLARELARLESNLALVADAAVLHDLERMAFPSRSPIAGGRISSGFGHRRDPFTGARARHTGIDMPAAYGTAILASAGGRVRFAGFRSAYGRTVEIDHGDGLVTRYGHASKLLVRAGDIVLPGQKIAAVGSTGRSTGPHVHFEVLRRGTPVEPRLYLARPAG